MNNQIICKVVAVFVLLCSPLPSHAENWVEFYFHTATSQTTGQTMSATESFYDSDSFRMFDNGTFKVWIKLSSSNSGEFARLFGKGSVTKQLVLINWPLPQNLWVDFWVKLSRRNAEGLVSLTTLTALQ